MSVPDIAAIVVTHHSASTIDDCLARLRAADGVAAIRVVDNASGDDTVAIVQRHAAADARLRFVANPDNPGFAVACNQGAAALDDVAAATWLAFVNPDCMVEADTLARLRQHDRQLDGNALLGADLVGEDGIRDAAARRRDPDFAAMLRDPSRAQLGVPVDDEPLQRVADCRAFDFHDVLLAGKWPKRCRNQNAMGHVMSSRSKPERSSRGRQDSSAGRPRCTERMVKSRFEHTRSRSSKESRAATVSAGTVFRRRRSAARFVRSASPSAMAARTCRAVISTRKEASLTKVRAASSCHADAAEAAADCARSTALSAA